MRLSHVWSGLSNGCDGLRLMHPMNCEQLTCIRSVGEVALREPRDEQACCAVIGSMLEEADRLTRLRERVAHFGFFCPWGFESKGAGYEIRNTARR